MLVTTRRAGATVAWALLATVLVVSSPIAADNTPDTIAAIPAVAGDTTLAGRVVYLDFWASWCVPCRDSFPWMNGLMERYRERGLRVVSVNLDKKPAVARKFMKDMHATFPVVYDSTGTLAKRYRLEVMPTSFLYGRDGKLRKREEGFHMDEHAISMEDMIESLLEEKGSK